MSLKLLAILRALGFVTLALVLCGAVFQLAGYSSAAMFASIAEGAFLSPHALVHTLRKEISAA